MAMQFEEIITGWTTLIAGRQKKHSEQASKLLKLHYMIGIPAVVFSAIAGCTLFAQSAPPTLRIAAGVFALVSAVGCAVQTLFDAKARSEKHRSADARLGQLRKTCEIALSYKPDSNESQKKLLDEINTQILHVDQDCPPLPSADSILLGSD